MTTLDSTSQEGTEGTPTPEGSGNESGQPSSGTVNLTKAEFDKFTERLDRLERDEQSNKDRAVKKTNERLSELETKVNPLLERAAEFIKDGKTPQDALRQAQSEQDDLEERQMLREFLQSVKDGKLPATLAGKQETAGVNVADVVEEYGLDLNDPTVKVAFEGNVGTREQAELIAGRLLKAKAIQPKPTDAQTSAVVAKPLSVTDADALAAEHSQLMKNPTKNMKRIAEIQEALTRG